MAARPMEMKRLDPAQSWELFRRKVGAGVANDPLIRQVAEEIVGHCSGLPLALITVGRAMTEKRLPVEWEHAARRLEGMDKSLLSALKYGHDCLRDDQMRSCLLYCSLFPENSDIELDQLVHYWIGEGFLDGNECEVSSHVARNRGYSFIRSLLSAGLLESGNWNEEKGVKLPDAVRDMVSTLTEPGSGGQHRFVTLAGVELTQVTVPSEVWAEATRVSLMCNKIDYVVIPPSPTLITLLLNDNPLYDLDITHFIPRLTVLDLSRTLLHDLPSSLGSMGSLRYLNLSRTWITSLPEALGSLRNLRQLDLSWTSVLSIIPRGAFSPLLKLQMLNLYMSGYCWCDCYQGAESILRSLEAIKPLDQFGLNINCLQCLDRLISGSPRLQRSTMFLKLSRLDGVTRLHLSKTFQTLTRLQELSLFCCRQLVELRVDDGQLLFLEVLHLSALPLSAIVVAPHSTGALLNLRGLHIESCHGLRSLTWAERLPSLEELHLYSCDGIELLTESEHEDTFPRLKLMDLNSLPKLRRLSCSPRLLLPSMERLHVLWCPNLKVLPFGPDSSKRLKYIHGEQGWWEKLEWDGEQQENALRATLESLFWPRYSQTCFDEESSSCLVLPR
uniref:Disease resistance protein RPS2 n=1 Tax=Anthurium amnicola TaxID=1678845 RepID=A0A1D1XWL4_9ARAE